MLVLAVTSTIYRREWQWALRLRDFVPERDNHHAGALALSVGIAIQNFPEGAIISLPLKEQPGKEKHSFMVRFRA